MRPVKVCSSILLTSLFAFCLFGETAAQPLSARRTSAKQNDTRATCDLLNAKLKTLDENSRKLAAGVVENQKAGDRIGSLNELRSDWDEIVTKLAKNPNSSTGELAEIKAWAPAQRRDFVSYFGVAYKTGWDKNTLGFVKVIRENLAAMIERFKRSPQSIVTLPEQRAEVEMQTAAARYNARKQNCNFDNNVTVEPKKEVSTIPTADFNSATLKDAKKGSQFCEVRFRGTVYTAVCEQQTEIGVPSDVYYYRTPGVAKVSGVNGGDLLWNRFVRTPAVGYKYQSEGTWLHIFWKAENGTWVRKIESNVAVEFLRKLQ